MSSLPSELRLTAGSQNTIELWARTDSDGPESLAGVVSWRFHVKDAPGGAVTILDTGTISSGIGTSTGILSYTISAPQAAALQAGTWWGFVTINYSGRTVHARDPIRVEVVVP